MTEEEACKKWCFYATAPLETSGVGIGIAINRNADGTPSSATLCIASACMAWRWKSGTEGFCGVAGPKGVEMDEAPAPVRQETAPA